MFSPGIRNYWTAPAASARRPPACPLSARATYSPRPATTWRRRSGKVSMDKFVITGGTDLKGEIATSGSKNSALPALAAALLTDEPVTLRRVPRVRDIRTMERLLVDIGSQFDEDGETVRLHTPKIVSPEAP